VDEALGISVMGMKPRKQLSAEIFSLQCTQRTNETVSKKPGSRIWHLPRIQKFYSTA
jgi:hypothetical protein